MGESEAGRNVKVLLVEAERKAWNEGQLAVAQQLAQALDYIGFLEDMVNQRDSEIERLTQARAAEKGDVSADLMMRTMRSLVKGADFRADHQLRVEICQPILRVCDGFLEGR